jgi:beta-N-acetylhexosaminidase
VLNWVQEEERDVLLGMGFDVLDAFEELSCAAERVSFLLLEISMVRFADCLV